jgi:hypothetical protein
MAVVQTSSGRWTARVGHWKEAGIRVGVGVFDTPEEVEEAIERYRATGVKKGPTTFRHVYEQSNGKFKYMVNSTLSRKEFKSYEAAAHARRREVDNVEQRLRRESGMGKRQREGKKSRRRAPVPPPAPPPAPPPVPPPAPPLDTDLYENLLLIPNKMFEF